jgi:hypothetical protein
MRKHAYIENADKAYCKDCGFRCEPMPEEDSRHNTFFLSDCCSEKIVEEDLETEWVADIVDGRPEP